MLKLLWTFFLYKINTCTNATPELVGYSNLELTNGKICGYFANADSSPLDILLQGTESLLFCCHGANGLVTLQGYVTMHITPTSLT